MGKSTAALALVKPHEQVNPITDVINHTAYTVRYRLRGSKKTINAYWGDDRAVYAQVVSDLMAREDVRFLYTSITQATSTLFHPFS